MTRVLAGPYCTQILGDLGAEVIKIEHPVRGDDTRAWGPPYAPYKPGSSLEGPGVQILHELVAKSDILVENYLPGSLKKYSLDYETLRAINPSLIYASITGYGQTGPYSARPGYDVMVEAEFGLMHITGTRDGPPVKVGVAVTDLTTGLYTSNSIMAALLGRAKTGRGQHIDVALSDCQTATLANIASSCLISGEKDTGRWGTAHPSIVPYRSFRTSDGDILLGGGNDKLFGILADRLGQPHWKHDPKFITNADRVANRQELEAMIEGYTQQKTTAEWLDIFEGRGMPYAAVNDVQGTLNHEHTKARDMVIEMEHDACGPIKMVNSPVKYSESQPKVRLAPPTLGQHTLEILRGELAMSESEITALQETGVISEHKHGNTMAGLSPLETENSIMAIDAHSRNSNKSIQPYVEDLAGVGSAPIQANTCTRVPYVPQFSTTSSFILSRMNNPSNHGKSVATSSLSLQPAIGGSEDAIIPLTKDTDGSMTMPLPTPANVTSGPSFFEQAMAASANRAKRKRDSDVEMVDFSQNTISFPTSTPSVNPLPATATEPSKITKNLCSICSQAFSTPQNRLVTCSRCLGSWHQQCVSPSIPDGACAGISFECSDCVIPATKLADLPEAEQQRRHRIERMREQRLSQLPRGVVPAKAELVGFGAGQSSTPARSEYFYGKKKTDLLNVLSFCDQLEPQLLVDILVSVSKKHPNLPMFDSPDWDRRLPSADRGRVSGEITYGEEDTLPPTWRKAGEGLYAKLAPEVDDRAFLVDENDEESFSQFMVDREGKQIIDGV
ncbi:Succinate--hydroxymethylglutarate CoA-transferase [Paramyrothecium foliicola]|nr:Succinate--hydroxymethylglutarate CoA-transferase [Paramyrothecium foliicola]